MKRFKLFGLTLVAVFVAGVAMSSTALALELPENLPASTTRTWTGKNVGSTTFAATGQEPIVCTAASGEGTETTSKPPAGAFHIDFSNCTTSAGGVEVKCTGLGDT